MASVGIIRTKSGAIYPKTTIFKVLKDQLGVVLAEIERFNELVEAVQEDLVLETGLLPKASEPTFHDAFDKVVESIDKLKAYIEIRDEMQKFADNLIRKLESLKV